MAASEEPFPARLVRRVPGIRASTALLVLALAAAAAAGAAPLQERRVAGTVTDDRGAPVAGAAIVLLPIAGGDSATAVTDAAGRYSVAAGAGERHELKARRLGFFTLVVEVSFAPGELRLERDLRLSPSAVTIAPLEARSVRPVSRPPAPRTPGGQEDPQAAASFSSLPLAPGDLDALASLQPGVFALGGERGVTIGGQAPSQSGTTLDGASYGMSSLPAEALGSAAVITSTFDPARGQFSGGQVAATTLSGTNLFGGAARFRFSDPALHGAGPERRSGFFGGAGGAGGALVRERLFWYAAGELTRRWDPLLTLESADTGALGELGIDPTAARRLRAAVEALDYPARPAAAGARRYRDLAAGLLRLDFAAHENHVLVARGDFRGRVAGRVGEQPFALGGSGMEVRDRSGGALAQLTSFVGDGRNELRLSWRGSRQERAPYLRAPAGEVLVPFGGDGSTRLRFGPGALGEGTVTASMWELADETAFPLGERRRMKAGFAANREETTRLGASNTLGTFTFNTLADLEAGRPSAFSRTLGRRTGRAASDYLALFAGQLWRPTDALSLIYGLRVEGRRYPRPGGDGARPAPVLGRIPGEVPDEWGVSPRLGFSYFRPGAGWDLRGGVGEFRGKIPVAGLADARAEDGGPGVTRLVCNGEAAPRPEWDRFLADPGEIPDACAGGEARLMSNLPRATLFGRGLGAPRTWKVQVAWNWSGALPVGYVGIGVEAGWTRGLSQPLAGDANFAAVPGFALAEEGGRTVYVPLAGVDTATGAVGVAASRVDPSLETVRLVESGGRSTTAEVTLKATLWRGLGLFVASYTHTRAHDQVGRLAAPWQASAPLSPRGPGRVLGGPSDLERRHLFQAHYSRPLPRLPGEIGVVARFASGQPYTPQIDRDVDGDGQANDPAFVFDPALAADSALRAGMEALLDGRPSVRECLLSQLGRVARRNRCRGPWTADFDLEAGFWPAQQRASRKLTVSLEAANVLAGVDRLLHGRDGLRGWGGSQIPDPTLLYVRGFDARRRAFRYEVNRNFGRSGDGEAVFSRPFTLTLQARWTFGVDPVRQPLLSRVTAMRSMGRSAEEVRQALENTVPNLFAQVLVLDDTLRLSLSEAQRETLAARADSFGARVAPIVDSLAAAVAREEGAADVREAREARARKAGLAREAQALLDAARQELRAALDTAQWNRLPRAVQQPAGQILPGRRGIDARRGDW